MSSSNFNTALKYVLVDEGGNDDDPRDHGGRTSRGITQREYDSWCRLSSKSGGDVWCASPKEISAVYKEQYWNPYCDDLPDGVDYLFFDMAVNSGRSQAVKTIQRALGLKVDGMMGQVTLASLQGTSDTPDVIKRVSEARRAFYRHLAQYPTYGKGWLRRVDHAEKGALAMDAGKTFKKPPTEPTPKANPTDTTKPTVSPETSGGAVIASGGILETLNSFKDSLEAYADSLQWIKYVLIGIAAVGLGYALWGYYKRSKVAQAV